MTVEDPQAPCAENKQSCTGKQYLRKQHSQRTPLTGKPWSNERDEEWCRENSKQNNDRRDECESCRYSSSQPARANFIALCEQTRILRYERR
jgi:hypothetical protein